MKILRAGETDLAAALKELSVKLSVGAGITSEASNRKTVAVFGEALSPIEVVRRVLRDVRERGDAAISEYIRKFDGTDLPPSRFRVTREEIAQAYEAAPQGLKNSLARAKSNIWKFQEHILHRAPPPMRNAEGGMITLQYRALNRVGVYAPGGSAAYPSTVLMAAIPAQVAGVRQVVLATPDGPCGKPRPETLAAAHEVGITEVYRIGSVQAIAALAYGTATIPRVDKIVGPGNIFVTLAKKEVYGETDLDMLAGPSEVLIIADSSADPRFLAADMLSQAEHDPAAAVLLTTDPQIAERTLAAIERQLPTLSREKAARSCLERFGFVAVTRDLYQAVELANQFAPEHLEIIVENPRPLLAEIHAAGAIFLGPFTPEPVGDYVAGPSHVLPTGGTARFFSGLNANNFIRRSAVIAYTEQALSHSVNDIVAIAKAEGLDAHARSAQVRFEKD